MSEYHPTRGPLRQALNLIAHSVKGQGKPEVWVDRILDTWHAETTHLSIEAIKLGAQTWIRSESFRPSLADFLTLCEMTRTTEEKERGARGCPDCLGTGWRWFYVHHHAPGSRSKPLRRRHSRRPRTEGAGDGSVSHLGNGFAQGLLL